MTRGEMAVLTAVYALSNGSTHVAVSKEAIARYVDEHRLLSISEEEFEAHRRAIVERAKRSRS